MDPLLPLAVSCFALVGVCIGMLSGLTPGIHVNTLALLLVAGYPLLEPGVEAIAPLFGLMPSAAPLLVSAVITSAAVSHVFMEVVPSIFLGAPDEELVLAVLPGHRLLLSGQGMDAVACAAFGGLIGVLLAVALCLPLYLLLGQPLQLAAMLDPTVPFVLVLAAIMLVWSECGEPQAKAMVDLRHGRVIRCTRSTISIVRPVPVDGEEVRLSGQVVRHCCHAYLVTAAGSWRLIGRSMPSGDAVIYGKWKVRISRQGKRGWAIALLLLSGLLGLAVMNLRLPLAEVWSGLDQSIMFPLLTGLFGLPTMLLSSSSNSIPPQRGPSERPPLRPALRGAVAGLLVGWFPGMTSTCGTIVGGIGRNREDADHAARTFMTMVSAVGASSAVFGLLALAIAGKGRSGAMLAVRSVLGGGDLPDLALPMLLTAALISAAVSYPLAMKIGRLFAKRTSGVDLGRLSRYLVMLLIGLVAMFNGLPGLIVLGVSTLLGLVPPKLGVSRVHLAGCLLVPVLIYFLGWKEAVLSLL